MRFTNKADLPAPIVEAVCHDSYTGPKGPGEKRISATGLIKPSRIWALERQHWDNIEEDAADRLYSLLGQLGHLLLERASGRDPHDLIQNLAAVATASQGTSERVSMAEDLLRDFYRAGRFIEQRLATRVNGWEVSGQFDYLTAERTITDYKFTSRWTVKSGPKPEWEAQQNIYRWLASRQSSPFAVDRLQIVAIFRDWSKPQAVENPDYGAPTQVGVFELPIWGLETAEQYVLDRIASHERALEKLPECSAEERWERDTSFAVMKEGRKSALRVLDSEEAAKEWMSNNVATKDWSKVRVDRRPGRQTRCLYYCPVRDFCSQWASLQVS